MKTKSKAEQMAEQFAEQKGNGIGDWFERRADFLAGMQAFLAEAEKMAEEDREWYGRKIVSLSILRKIMGKE